MDWKKAACGAMQGMIQSRFQEVDERTRQLQTHMTVAVTRYELFTDAYHGEIGLNGGMAESPQEARHDS